MSRLFPFLAALLSTLPLHHAATPVQASFAARSYSPGAVAVLVLRGADRPLRVRVFRSGMTRRRPMGGAPVSRVFVDRDGSSRLFVPVGAWPSGLYFAEVDSEGGAWVAPFIVRPARLGVARVAVVLPTNTWQAYNFEGGDSWYLDDAVHDVDLTRPFADGGVPPYYRGYDRGFIRWLTLHHRHPDFLSDDDLDHIARGDDLARAYDLIVFPGHEEYVTAHEYDIVQRYRDLGGNLAFLSANNFFYAVEKHGDVMHGRQRWRDLGRPEAALVGEQYVDWDHDRYPNVAYRVVGRAKAPWLFRGTSLTDGSTFGRYGIEVDGLAPASPPGTAILARIAGIFGPGEDANMTYYETPEGAKVFAAGVMNFGGSSLWPGVRTMVANLWRHLSAP